MRHRLLQSFAKTAVDRNSVDLDEVMKDCLSYHQTVGVVAARFPFTYVPEPSGFMSFFDVSSKAKRTGIALSFKWGDSFRRDQHMTEHAADFEQFCLLYNLGMQRNLLLIDTVCGHRVFEPKFSFRLSPFFGGDQRRPRNRGWSQKGYEMYVQVCVDSSFLFFFLLAPILCTLQCRVQRFNVLPGCLCT